MSPVQSWDEKLFTSQHSTCGGCGGPEINAVAMRHVATGRQAYLRDPRVFFCAWSLAVQGSRGRSGGPQCCTTRTRPLRCRARCSPWATACTSGSSTASPSTSSTSCSSSTQGSVPSASVCPKGARGADPQSCQEWGLLLCRRTKENNIISHCCDTDPGKLPLQRSLVPPVLAVPLRA